MDARFLVNAKAETITDAFVRRISPRGWLGSPINLSSDIETRLRSLRDGEHWTVADNNNFADMGYYAAALEPAAKPIVSRLASLRSFLRRDVNWKDIVPDDRVAIKDLCRDIRLLAASSRWRSVAQRALQLRMEPTYIIGDEDITLPTALRLGLDTESIPWGQSQIRRFNEAVASRWKACPTKIRDISYPVATALSYDHANAAGQVFASNGIRRAAMGFGAYMADTSWMNGYTLGRRKIALPEALPSRYVRTALVARGFFDGYRSVAGHAPDAFHFLGLGSPITMTLVARAAMGSCDVSFDATSPIKDALEGTIYVTKPALLKVTAWKVAVQLASSGGKVWDCPCNACRDFISEHPMDYVAATASLPLSPSEADLGPGGALYEAMPLFSSPREHSPRISVYTARMGHNHWALQSICDEVTAHSGDTKTFDAQLDQVVQQYVGSTKSDASAKAVLASQRIVTEGLGQ